MKRVISVILVAALVLALLPTFAFAAESSAESYVYNFTNKQHIDPATGAAPTLFSGYTLENFASSTTDKWGFIKARVVNAASNAWMNGDRFWYRPKVVSGSYTPVYCPGVQYDSTKEFMMMTTFAIVVGEDGVYTPGISLVSDKSSPVFEVFLTEDVVVSDDTKYLQWVNGIAADKRLGRINGYGDGAVVSKKFLDVELKAGTYYLTVVANGKDSSFEYYDSNDAKKPYGINLYLSSFALKNVNDVNSGLSYNTTSSALKDPTTAESYNMPAGYDKGGITGITYSVLKDAENKFSVAGTRYCQNAKMTDSGLQFDMLVNRYAEYVSNSYFAQDGDGNWIAGKDANGNLYTSIYGHSTHIAIKLNVPYAGDYKLYLLNPETDFGAVSNVFFVSAPANFYYANNNTYLNASSAYKLPNRHDSRTVHSDSSKEYIGEVSVAVPGDYYLLFAPNGECFEQSGKEKTDGGFQTLSISGIKLEPIVEENTDLIEEQEKFDEIEKIKTDEIAKPVDSGLSNVATVNILETEINSDEAFEQTARKVTGTYGEMMTVVAEPKAGYEFLYWAKGIGNTRKVVSENAEYKFKAVSGGTWLTAVYKNKASTDVSVVFYNGNGEEVSRQLVEQGSQITMPALPTLRGHEASTGWAIGNRKELYAAGDDVTATGSQMLFVAQFNDPSKSISVKVNGADYGTYAYGDKVTVTATERENGNGDNVFVYWKKGDEIVSFDKTYSFLASENCELTACYNAYRPITDALKKIVISGSGQNIMVEFIGLADAVEKGIIFDENSAENITFSNATHKITMTQDGNQLAAVADIGTYIGYAILADGNVIYDK